MSKEWIKTTLGNVLTLQRGFDLPVTERQPGPYPVIASTGTVGFHSHAMVKAPGVVIGRSGSIGGGQYILSDFWPLNTTLWVKDFKGNDKRFCYYLLKSIDLANFNAGSGVPTLNRNHIHPLPVLVPKDIGEQRAISHILGTLDDKIELNRRMNETLEAMAKALFKSWFVDFDPVRAKAEGRDPGLPKEIADLFPDSFEDLELGKIPKGWKIGVIGDLGEVICGKTPPTRNKDNYGGDIPFVTIPDMHDRVFITTTANRLSEKGASTQKNKWLPQLTVCVSCIATPGLVALTSKESQTNQQINSIICHEEISPYWCFLQIGTMKSEIINAGSGGSATLNLNKGQFSQMKVLIPSQPCMMAFHKIVAPIFGQIFNNDIESETLVSARNGLLPKLLSGEILIEDPNRFQQGART